MPPNLGFGRSYDVFGAEAEFLHQLLDRCRGAKTFDTDVVPVGDGVFSPAKSEASSTETRALTCGGNTESLYC